MTCDERWRPFRSKRARCACLRRHTTGRGHLARAQLGLQKRRVSSANARPYRDGHDGRSHFGNSRCALAPEDFTPVGLRSIWTVMKCEATRQSFSVAGRLSGPVSFFSTLKFVITRNVTNVAMESTTAVS